MCLLLNLLIELTIQLTTRCRLKCRLHFLSSQNQNCNILILYREKLYEIFNEKFLMVTCTRLSEMLQYFEASNVVYRVACNIGSEML